MYPDFCSAAVAMNAVTEDDMRRAQAHGDEVWPQEFVGGGATTAQAEGAATAQAEADTTPLISYAGQDAVRIH